MVCRFDMMKDCKIAREGLPYKVGLQRGMAGELCTMQGLDQERKRGQWGCVGKKFGGRVRCRHTVRKRASSAVVGAHACLCC